MTSRRALVLLLAGGLLLRVVLALTTPGIGFDTESFHVVAGRLLDPKPWRVYPDVNGDAVFLHWPYPPGFFPVLAGLAAVLGTGHAFDVAERLPMVAADLAIAFLLFQAVRRTRGDRHALLCAGVVAFGPCFLATSSAHGQLDALVALAVLSAVLVWRTEAAHRALLAGALLGVGATVKTVPVFFLVALLPTLRSRRELVQLVGSAAVIPAVCLAPFFLSTPHAVVHALSYRGFAGLGGISLLMQPELAVSWLGGERHGYSALSDHVQSVGGPLALLALAVTAVLLVRRRAEPALAAVVVALTLWAYGLNFSFGYALWGLPLLLLAGYVRSAVALQLALLGPLLMVFAYGHHGAYAHGLVYGFYVPVMLALLLVAVVAHARLLRRA